MWERSATAIAHWLDRGTKRKRKRKREIEELPGRERGADRMDEEVLLGERGGIKRRT
jgi:hypothetical protein